MHRFLSTGLLVALVTGCHRSDSRGGLTVHISEVLPGNGNAGRNSIYDFSWVELHNPNSVPLDISRFYLSDNPENVRKWRLPNGTLMEPFGYLVVRVGGDPDPQYPLQATFGLSSDGGEVLSLVAPDGVTFMDRILLPRLGRDRALVRVERDDGIAWRETLTPTPGGANSVESGRLRVTEVGPTAPYAPVVITVQAASRQLGADVRLHYTTSASAGEDPRAWPSLAMQPAGGDLWRIILPGRGLRKPTVLRFAVRSVGADGAEVFDPSLATAQAGAMYHRIEIGSSMTLVIAEIMPWNASLLVEGALGTPDWVEVHNTGQKTLQRLDTVVLRDYYLGRSWQLPARSLAPGGRLVVARDSASERRFGPTRAGGIVQLIGVNAVELDRVSLPELDRDVSMGRAPLARGAPLKILDEASPGYANHGDTPVWFIGQVPVWAQWDGMTLAGRMNAPAGEMLRVETSIGWRGAVDRVPPPDVVLYLGGAPQGAMHAPLGSEVFTAEIGPFVAGQVLDMQVGVMADGNPMLSPPRRLTVGYIRPDVRITEIGMTGEYAGADGAERRITFVELYNGGDAPFDLSGTFLSLLARDAGAVGARFDTEEWEFLEGTIAPGAYHVVWLDGGGDEGAPSLLARHEGGAASLYDTIEAGNGVIDRLVYPSLTQWQDAGAFGRVSPWDVGEGVRMAPSPGAPNPQRPALTVNEVSLWGAGQKWIELYNAAPEGTPPVDPAGFRLVSDRDEAVIEGAVGPLAPGDHALVWLGPPAMDRLTASIAFNAARDTVLLFAPAGSPWTGAPLESVPIAYTPGLVPEAGLTLGRIPDGGTGLGAMPPSPGEANCDAGMAAAPGPYHAPAVPAPGEAIAFDVRVRDVCSVSGAHPAGRVTAVRVHVEGLGAPIALAASTVDGGFSRWLGAMAGQTDGTVLRYVIEAESAWARREVFSMVGAGDAIDWDSAFVIAVGGALPAVTVNEVYPDGDAGFVELFNDGAGVADLGGYVLEMAGAEGGEVLYAGVIETGTLIDGGGFLVFDFEGLAAANAVRLRTPSALGSIVLSTLAFSDLPSGYSWGAYPDGTGAPAVLHPTPGLPNRPRGVMFIRGDCNEDGVMDMRLTEDNADFQALLAVLSGAAPPLQCEKRCDINDDGVLNLSDVTYFVRNFFYRDPPLLPPPFPEPGLDPTEDALRCE